MMRQGIKAIKDEEAQKEERAREAFEQPWDVTDAPLKEVEDEMVTDPPAHADTPPTS